MAVAEPAAGFPALSPRLRVCADGYLRMALADFSAIPLFHLMTRLHEDRRPGDALQTRVSPIFGYTEWVSRTRPAITLGWDWVLGAQQGQVQCRREGAPYGNVMLTCPQRRDLGDAQTALLLGEAIDAQAWQHPALDGVKQVYSPGTCQI